MRTNRNLITDVPGLRIGNAQDQKLGSGVTVALFDEPAIASCAVIGGAPGTRETDLLEPDKMAPGVHAIVLSGGSALGLDAACGVQAFLRQKGIGFAVGPRSSRSYLRRSYSTCSTGATRIGVYRRPIGKWAFRRRSTAGLEFELGTAGGGYGATTVNLKGGLGSASVITSAGHAVGAIAVVNSISSAVIGDGPHFWAAALEEGAEFGGLGHPRTVTPAMRELFWKGGAATFNDYRAGRNRRDPHQGTGQAPRPLIPWGICPRLAICPCAL